MQSRGIEFRISFTFNYIFYICLTCLSIFTEYLNIYIKFTFYVFAIYLTAVGQSNFNNLAAKNGVESRSAIFQDSIGNYIRGSLQKYKLRGA